jgi:hypothetical protein
MNQQDQQDQQGQQDREVPENPYLMNALLYSWQLAQD